MQVDATDLKPPSLFHHRPPNLRAIVIGAGLTLALHLGAPAMIAALMPVCGNGSVEAGETCDDGNLNSGDGCSSLCVDESSEAIMPPPPQEFVEARFVKLGTQLDPRRLPDRPTPQANTAPQNPNRFSKRNRIRRSDQRHNPQPDSINDMLQRLGDRAEQFEREAIARQIEGHEQGVQGGTETDATAANLYNGQLYRFFRRGWSVPTTIPDDARRSLVLRVQVSIGHDRRVTGFSLGGSSGNASFDESVRSHLQRIQGSGRLVPEPPAAVAHRYLGRQNAFRFTGR